MEVGKIVTNREGDYDKIIERIKSDELHSLNYIFCDGKTVTKKYTWMNILNGYIQFKDWVENERRLGYGDLRQDTVNYMRCLSNEGVFMYSFLKTYGNTLKNRNILKKYSNNYELIKCIKSVLKGSKRYTDLIKQLYTTRMFMKFLECEDTTETVVNLHDIPSFELLNEKQKELRLKEIESYLDENSKDYWKKQPIVKRLSISWDEFKKQRLHGGIVTSFGMETIMETIH